MFKALHVLLGVTIIYGAVLGCGESAPAELQRMSLTAADAHEDQSYRESYGCSDCYVYEVLPDCEISVAPDVCSYSSDVDALACGDVAPPRCNVGPCSKCPEGLYCTPEGICVSCELFCEDRECGPSPCGWACGSCRSHEYCVESICRKKGETGEPCSDDSECVSGRCLTELGKDAFCTHTCDGICPKGFSCKESVRGIALCIPDSCEPNCGDKVCGNDGCGAACGQCPDDERCQAGTCGA